MVQISAMATPLVLVPRPSGERDGRELAAFVRAHATVTLALERWCQLTGLGDGPVTARLLGPVVEVTPDAEIAAALGAELGGTQAPASIKDAPPKTTLASRGSNHRQRVMRREVALCLGPHTLATAENWYVPDRLPPTMANALLTTTTPFGHLITSLGAHRIAVCDLVLNSGRSGSNPSGGVERDQRIVFAQQAIICSRDGTRLAVVRERFLDTLLGDPIWIERASAAAGQSENDI